MGNPFGESKSSLKARLQDLQASYDSRGRRIATLEKQIKNRTGVEFLDPDGVRAMLLHHEMVSGNKNSARSLAVFKSFLHCPNIMGLHIYNEEDGSIVIRGDSYNSCEDWLHFNEILLPATIRYAGLTQIATILLPLYFELFENLLPDVDGTFYTLAGKEEYLAYDNLDIRRITLLPPESNKVVVISDTFVEERDIDLLSCKKVIEEKETLDAEKLQKLEEFHTEAMTRYHKAWWADLNGVKFTDGAKD